MGNHLFQLIKKLTISEKRYFTIATKPTQKKASPDYVKLFKMMDKQTVYDEGAIKKKYASEKWVNTRNFIRTKDYLYKIILDVLHQYHSSSSKKEKIKKKIHQADILSDKGFYQKALKMLSSVKDAALKLDMNIEMLNILKLERKLQYHLDPMDKDKKIEALYDNKNKAIHIVENLVAFDRKHSQIDRISKKHGRNITEEIRKELDDFLTDPLLNSIENALCFEAKVYYYQIHALFHFLKGNSQEAYKYNRGVLNLFEEHDEKVYAYPHKYIGCWYNFALDGIALGKYKDVFNQVYHLRSLVYEPRFEKMPNIGRKIFVRVSVIELNAYINKRDFEKGLKSVKTTEKGLKEMTGFSNQELGTLYCLMATFFLENDKIKEAKEYIDKMFALEKKGKTAYLYIAVRMLKVMLMYEEYEIKGDKGLIQYMPTLITEFKDEDLYKKECELVFPALSIIIEEEDRKKKQQLWNALNKQLGEVSKKERVITKVTSFRRWIERMVAEGI